MKAAFSTWEERIAPVFDVGSKVHVVEAESGRIIREAGCPLREASPARKVVRLAEEGVDVLVCGAISRHLQALVAAQGIQLVPFVAGELRRVVDAWISGTLENGQFAMPGCHRRGRGGVCTCPACGHEQPHKPGKPCRRLTCSVCGSALIRR